MQNNKKCTGVAVFFVKLEELEELELEVIFSAKWPYTNKNYNVQQENKII